MIIVAGWIEFAEGDAGPYVEMRQAANEATLQEPGCIEYTFTADSVHSGRVHLFERWETKKDLEVHQELLRSRPPSASSYTATAREVTIYDATPLSTS